MDVVGAEVLGLTNSVDHSIFLGR